LDDLGYDVNYHFTFSLDMQNIQKRIMIPEVSLNAWIRNTKESEEYVFIGFDIKISINKNDIKNQYFYRRNNEQSIKLDSDVSRYSLLLKEHLDYVNDITFRNTTEMNSQWSVFIKIRL
jgi:hypothetical protein